MGIPIDQPQPPWCDGIICLFACLAWWILPSQHAYSISGSYPEGSRMVWTRMHWYEERWCYCSPSGVLEKVGSYQNWFETGGRCCRVWQWSSYRRWWWQRWNIGTHSCCVTEFLDANRLVTLYMLFWIFVYLCGKVFVCKGVCVCIYGFNALQVDFRFFFPVITYTFHNHQSGTWPIYRVVLMRGSVVALQSRIPTSPHCHPSAKWTKMMFLTKWP